MLVLVRGDPAFTKTEVIGLDILAPRHPKLYALIAGRLGLEVNASTNVSIFCDIFTSSIVVGMSRGCIGDVSFRSLPERNDASPP